MSTPQSFLKTLFCLVLLTQVPLWLSLFATANSQVYSQNTSQNSTGLVFGASVIDNQYPSAVLQRRLDKSIKLFKSKNIISIIVSGATNTGYDEPAVMKDYLVRNNIPSNKVLADNRGFDTLSSCQNAKNIFKVDTVTIITQHFHIPRAVTLCNYAGLKTILAPVLGNQNTTIWGTFREFFAYNWNITRIIKQNI